MTPSTPHTRPSRIAPTKLQPLQSPQHPSISRQRQHDGQSTFVEDATRSQPRRVIRVAQLCPLDLASPSPVTQKLVVIPTESRILPIDLEPNRSSSRTEAGEDLEASSSAPVPKKLPTYTIHRVPPKPKLVFRTSNTHDEDIQRFLETSQLQGSRGISRCPAARRHRGLQKLILG